MSEMKSHVEDGDVARSPAVSPEAPPAEQDPNKVRAVSPIPWVSATNSPHFDGRPLLGYLPPARTPRRGSAGSEEATEQKGGREVEGPACKLRLHSASLEGGLLPRPEQLPLSVMLGLAVAGLRVGTTVGQGLAWC